MFYVYDDKNNKVEAYDKEGVLALLEQVIEGGSLENIDANTAFVTKLKDFIDGETHKVAFITQATYNELLAAGTLEAGAYYFITDDTSLEDLETAIEDLGERATDLESRATDLESRATDLETSVNKLSQSAITQFGDYIYEKKELLWEGSAAGDDSVSTTHIMINNLLGTFGIGDKILVKGVYDWVENDTVRESLQFEYIFFQGSERCTCINYIYFPNGNHGVPSVVTNINNQTIGLSRYLIYFAGDGTTRVGSTLNSLKITALYKIIG